jgi:hypothetical protein
MLQRDLGNVAGEFEANAELTAQSVDPDIHSDNSWFSKTWDLTNELRPELWVKAICPQILTDFMNSARDYTKPLKF